MDNKIVLIDGHSIINRAFYGVPELTNSQGLHTNGIYGFLNIMLKIIDEENPGYMVVAFDVKAPTFRHEMYKEYKGTRKGMPDELHEQVPVLKEVLHSMGIVTIEKAGFEADDILGTIAKKCESKNMKVSLVSGDRDLLQIATDNICIRIPKTKKGKTEIENYYTQDVVDLYGVTPLEFIDMKALMGDSSDNIPGVPGIGEKTAGKLIAKYHSIENIKEHIDEVTPKRAKENFESNYKIAVLSKILATIKTDCDIDFETKDAKIDKLFTPEAYEFMKKLEFKSLLARFSKDDVVSFESKKDNIDIKILEDDNSYADLKEKIEKQDTISFALWGDAVDVFSDEQVLAGGVFFNDVLYAATEKEAAEKLAEVINNASCRKITIHLKKQLAALCKCSVVNEGTYDDIGLMAYLLNPLKDSYDYDDISRDYLQEMIPSRTDILGKLSIEKAIKTSKEEVINMTLLCCKTISRSVCKLRGELKKQGMLLLYEDMELPLLYTLFSMQKYGIRTDKEALKHYGEKLSSMVSGLENEIYELAGEKFNINSPKQLGVILFEKLKFPAAKKTKTGYSTAADVLEKLRPDYPIVDKVLKYRTITKLKSTYADGLYTFIKSDGRIHGNFHQTITATGRISSSEPNLQNIPVRMELGREIRKIFIPEDGFVFVDADYSQIELRVLAHMSGDERLIAAYNQAEDIHAITASQVFHVPMEEITPQIRRNAKAVNFGIVYGISAFGLSEDLSITRKEAKEYMDKYFNTYPKIKEFLDSLIEDAKKNGVSKTLFGRIRPVPELKSSNFMQRQFGERVAMNAPIQGTAADIIKYAMIHVDKRLKEETKKSRLILQIHDELLVEAYCDEVEVVKKIVDEEMTRAAKLSVSLEIDMHSGKNWYEAK